MAIQNNSKITEMQKKILVLEKKYFKKVIDIVESESFKKDLLIIEKCIIEDYEILQRKWNLKNKIKIAAERLCRHHFYGQLDHKSIYYSPISADIAFELEDAVLHIDIKTNDTIGNKSDTTTTQFEYNQTSFKHKNWQSDDKYPGVDVSGHLNPMSRDGKIPSLTYLIKIIYSDDKKSFKLLKNDGIIVTCLPNGKLSSLFNNELISNFKTYKSLDIKNKDTRAIKLNYKGKGFLTHDQIISKINKFKNMHKLDYVEKAAFYDIENDALWRQIQKKKTGIQLEVLDTPKSGRYESEFLIKRLDENNNPWNGIKKISID